MRTTDKKGKKKSAEKKNQGTSKKETEMGPPNTNEREQPCQNPKVQRENIETGNEVVGNVDLDENIRNDVFKTEVNPHAQKRTPLQKQKEEGIDRKDLNIDERIVNDPDDEIQEDKYLL